jgi:hypothetical protein
MSPERLAECIEALGWSKLYLAQMTGRDHKQVRRWMAGARIPPEIAQWVEARARHAERTPPPVAERAA